MASVVILIVSLSMASSNHTSPQVQASSSKLPPLEEIRTFVAHSSSGTLSTFSKNNKASKSDFTVDFACDAYGFPIIAVSSSAAYAKDLKANPKWSLLVAKDLEDKSDLVIKLHGDAVAMVSAEDRDNVRTAYLSMHPNASWADSDDFQFIRIEPTVVEYERGVATDLHDAGEFSKEEYKAAKVDPIYQFSKPISNHMNKDHTDDTKLIVQHSTSYPVTSAKMIDVDSLGFNVKADVAENTLKLRIPFPRRAMDRKDVRILVIEMLQAARASLVVDDKDL